MPTISDKVIKSVKILRKMILTKNSTNNKPKL